MPLTSKATVIIVALIASGSAASAKRSATINRETFVCESWAAWREYGLASLAVQGARMSKSCPLRLAAKTKVVVVDEDAGAGASEIRYRSKIWFVDNQALE